MASGRVTADERGDIDSHSEIAGVIAYPNTGTEGK